MDTAVIVVSSVTYAIRSRELLAAHGIPAYVERVARTPATGCGYGVFVPRGIDKAEMVLRNHGIRVMGRAAHGKNGAV